MTEKKKAAAKKPVLKSLKGGKKAKEEKAGQGPGVKKSKSSKSVPSKIKESPQNPAPGKLKQFPGESASKAEKEPAANRVEEEKRPTTGAADAPAPIPVPEKRIGQRQEKAGGGLFGKLFSRLGGGGGERFPGPKGEKTWTNSIGMEFVLIPAGKFMMGSELERTYQHPEKMPDSHKDNPLLIALWEKNKGKILPIVNTCSPVHEVTITRQFYMAKFPTTLAAWQEIMGNNPLGVRKDGIHNLPDVLIFGISWHDAQKFIEKLNKREKAVRYRLPTEAEWEYAVRAGTTTEFFWGDNADYLSRYIYSGLDGYNRAERMKEFQQPNPWGLYGVYGHNQWVQDWYKNDSPRYPSNAQTDPLGPDSGKERVLRGGDYWGTYINGASKLGSALRFHASPDSACHGFRLALVIEE